MKKTKSIITVVLIALIGYGWFAEISGFISGNKKANELAQAGVEYTDKKLYQKAIEAFTESLTYKENPEVRDGLIEAYELGFGDNVVSKSELKKALETAATIDSKNSVYWEKLIELCIDTADYSNAYTYCKEAMNAGSKSNLLNELIDTVSYSFSKKSKMYRDVYYCPDGYMTLFDGEDYGAMSVSGEWLYKCDYDFVSPIGQDHSLLVVTPTDKRIVDEKNVVQAYITDSFDAVKAIGNDILPMQKNGSWIFYDYSKNKAVGEKYENVTSFQNKKAFAYKNNKWVQVDIDGEKQDVEFEDIKLYTNGEYSYKSIMVAAKDGMYSVYDRNGKSKTEFTAKDMDNYYGGLIAYQDNNGKWGYINKKGEVVIEASYENAKSFSNNLGAVCVDDKWGFINEDGKLVIENQFLDVGYFTANGRNLVSSSESEFYEIERRIKG